MVKASAQKSKKFSEFPITRIFPNIITVMAICCGFTSVRYALDQQWMMAVNFIIIAGFLDVVDGRLARFLKATSDFGAQLDSLADFVNFGIAPSIVIYLWSLHNVEINGLGWAFSLSFTVCTAVRLARFNSDLLDVNRPDWKNGFFTGIPSPAGAYLAIMPIMLSFEIEAIKHFNPIYLGIYITLVGLMMASRIPTFATKRIIIKKENISFVLVVAGLIVGAITIDPWGFLPIFGLIYICSIPFSIIAYKKMSNVSIH